MRKKNVNNFVHHFQKKKGGGGGKGSMDDDMRYRKGEEGPKLPKG